VTPRRLVAAMSLAAALAAPLAAAAPPPPARHDLDAAYAAQAAAARNYRESLEALLPFHEAAAERAEARLTRDRELVARGVVAAADVTASERALEDARAAVDKTRAEIAQAAALAAEAAAARELAALPPAAPGAVQTGATLIRHEGRAPWSLAQLPALERFFTERFHRPLPISARGQTPVHDRLGFDHRDALDVAVTPDSPEGTALMAYLRGAGISFMAFRGAVKGEATGAHIHVGPASRRL